MKLLPLLESKNGFGLLLAFALFVSTILASYVTLNVRSGQLFAASESSIASCYIAPNPSNASVDFNIFGSGLAFSQNLALKLTNSGGLSFLTTATDGSGSFSATWHSYYSGTNTIYVYDPKTNILLTSCSFEVN